MNIITIDNDSASLDALTTAVKKAIEALKISKRVNVRSFSSSSEALKFSSENSCDIVFTDTDMHGIDGIGLVYKLREINSKVNVIFVTEAPQDAFEAVQLQLHLSGYILKQPTKEMILDELCNLWYPIEELMPLKSKPVV